MIQNVRTSAEFQERALDTDSDPKPRRANPRKPGALCARQERAALEVALDTLSNDRIAEQAGVTARTLQRWKETEAFKRRVQELHAEFRKVAQGTGIASQEERLLRQNEHWRLLQEIIGQRARQGRALQEAGEGEGHDEPGIETGLLIKRIRGSGSGDTFQRVVEYEVDTATLTALSRLERLTTWELGQHDHHKGGFSAPGSGALMDRDPRVIVGYSIGMVVDIAREFLAFVQAGRMPATPEEAVALAQAVNEGCVAVPTLSAGSTEGRQEAAATLFRVPIKRCRHHEGSAEAEPGRQ